MEKKLARLFDYQKFEGNSDLEQVISSVHARYSRRELTEEETDWVNAAGTPEMMLPDRGKEDKPK